MGFKPSEKENVPWEVLGKSEMSVARIHIAFTSIK
jgi:hypothetical protein